MSDFNLEPWTRIHNKIPQGIKFLEHTFTEPTSFRLRVSPVSPGVYAILAADHSGEGTQYEVIYFGDCDDFSRQAARTHELYHDWLEAAGGLENLYVAYYSTPFRSEGERRAVKNSWLRTAMAMAVEATRVHCGSNRRMVLPLTRLPSAPVTSTAPSRMPMVVAGRPGPFR